MQNGFRKGFKPSIVKFLAILMGICYLMNPLHQQFITVFHKISHGLDFPNFVIPHATPSDHQQLHGNHYHFYEQTFHDHVLLDLVSSFFEASNEDNRSDNSFFFTTELDKHLFCNLPLKYDIHIVITDNYYNMAEKNTQKGFFPKSVKPPLH
ncbi:hypothetical protein H4O18_18055 [Arenibacter sp. BSSL-BM3]|uniref:Uncharacterized protein n=1 Tax=Arenibacter arenosicollis TaxID=2762274 RepID=A0ABR7QSK4_9FLAO|nr:hypothetical protein [Arenibacter arenosicollis]MBC8769907.1 hypothetical protein [Arenibacter arenosicollis]